MRISKKLLSLVLAVGIGFTTAGILSAAADQIADAAVYAQGDLILEGSGIIKGDGIITKGKLSGGSNPWTTGHIYAADKVKVGELSDVNKPLVKNYNGEIINYIFKDYKNFPETTYFMNKSTEYKDGTKDLVIGWDESSGEKPSGFTLKADSFIRHLTVEYEVTLNIEVPQGQLRVIRAEHLTMNGTIAIKGGGRVILYVDRMFSGMNGKFNATGSSFGSTDQFTLIIDKGDNNISFNGARIGGHVIYTDNRLPLANIYMQGNLYTKGYIEMSGTAYIKGLVYVPNSRTQVQNSSYIMGRIITDYLTISGSSYVQKGSVSGLPSDVAEFIGDKNDGQAFDETQPSQTTTTASSTQSTQSTQTTQTTGTTTTQPTDDDDDDENDNGEVVITVTVARRMSIRLENGKILKNGDKFTMPKLGTIRYQVCTNNWDTNTYTDDGQGIAGQKVFEFTHQKNKERYLRVDNNRHFMPVRFHFVKGDYRKLTGVDKVLSTPLESLSINFPLGATVNVKAYVKNQMVESRNLFIDSKLEWVNWNH